jgi:hypothetical protein
MVMAGMMVVFVVVMAREGWDAHHGNGDEEQQQLLHGWDFSSVA